MKPCSSTSDPSPRRLFDDLFASREIAEVFSDRARVQGLLEFEGALARAEADVGVVPRSAAAAISSRCHAELFDTNALTHGVAVSGNLAIPVVRALTDLVARQDPEAARFVHWGATSQDAIDTGYVLQLRAAFDIFDSDIQQLSDVLSQLATRHRHTLQLGRTWLQAAPPITFGLKVAGWLSAIRRQQDQLRQLRARVLVIQLGGAVGTLASLGAHALPIAMRLGDELQLTVPDLPWHAQRDRVADAGSVFGLLTGTLGKMARDVSLMMQSELAEVFEPLAGERGGSSTMPHKHNPVAAAAILSAAIRVPALVSTLFAAMTQEHERGLGGWHAEWETLPEICRLAAGALKHSVEVFGGLDVDAARMRANLDNTFGIVLAEPVALALARHMDRRAAHDVVARACQLALAEHKELREVLREEREVTSRLSATELDRLCDPSAYVGLADAWIERVLSASKQTRPWGNE